MTERLVVGGVALLAGLLLGWMVRGVATYNSNTETVVAYDDWRTACPPAASKEQPCQMIQEILDSKTRSPVARVSFTRDKDKQVMVFTMPLGVALEPGLGLQIAKEPVKVFPYRTCNTVGCIAIAPYDDKLAASLAASPTVSMLFLSATSSDGKPVSLPLSLKGFGAARQAYLKNESKRSAWFWRLWS